MATKFQNKLSEMNKYSIYCTPEQTKKALELGTPIEFIKVGEGKPLHYICSRENKGYYKIPTAEQMIGWLEENNIENIIVCKKDGGDYGYTVYHTSHKKPLQRFWFSNRKEATLAAIDAALEYISNKK